MEEMTLPQAISHLKKIQLNLKRSTPINNDTILFKRKTVQAIDVILREVEPDDGK